MAEERNYALTAQGAGGKIDAPPLPYEPLAPAAYNPPIALVGCGGITATHLTAYARAGLKVVAFYDVDAARAEARRDEFYPDARVYSDYAELLARDDIEVLDVATHAGVRPGLIDAALRRVSTSSARSRSCSTSTTGCG